MQEPGNHGTRSRFCVPGCTLGLRGSRANLRRPGIRGVPDVRRVAESGICRLSSGVMSTPRVSCAWAQVT
jgi:hypothetical protein